MFSYHCVCLHVHMHEHVYVCPHAYVCLHMWSQGPLLGIFLICSTPYYLKQGLLVNMKFTNSEGSKAWCLVSASPVLELQVCATILGFWVGVSD